MEGTQAVGVSSRRALVGHAEAESLGTNDWEKSRASNSSLEDT